MSNMGSFIEHFTNEILGRQLEETIDTLITGELGLEAMAGSRSGAWTDTVESDLSTYTPNDVEADFAGQKAFLVDDEKELEAARVFEEENDSITVQETPDDIEYELEHDLDIKNPEEESSAVAPTKAEPVTEELTTFGEMLGINMDNLEGRDADISNNRRLKPRGGKVSGFGG